jgi:hypothetical protein
VPHAVGLMGRAPFPSSSDRSLSIAFSESLSACLPDSLTAGQCGHACKKQKNKDPTFVGNFFWDRTSGLVAFLDCNNRWVKSIPRSKQCEFVHLATPACLQALYVSLEQSYVTHTLRAALVCSPRMSANTNDKRAV